MTESPDHTDLAQPAAEQTALPDATDGAQPAARQGSAGDDGSDAPDPAASAAKDPSEWTTGDEPPTGPQLSYLETLAREAGADVPEDLTKASASQLIDELQQRTGRGTS